MGKLKQSITMRNLLEKAATIKRFKYSALGKELIAQNGIAKKQYKKLDDTCGFDTMITKEELTFKNYNKSNLIYNSKYSFYNYYGDSKKFVIFLSNQSIRFYTNF